MAQDNGVLYVRPLRQGRLRTATLLKQHVERDLVINKLDKPITQGRELSECVSLSLDMRLYISPK